MSSFEEKSRLVSHVELTITGFFAVGFVSALLDLSWFGLPLATFIITAIIYGVRCCLVYICLHKGVQQREMKKLKIWLIFNLVVYILDMIGVIIMVFNITSYSLGTIFLVLVMLVYKGITMWIIFKFYQEIKQNPQMDKTNGGINF